MSRRILIAIAGSLFGLGGALGGGGAGALVAWVEGLILEIVAPGWLGISALGWAFWGCLYGLMAGALAAPLGGFIGGATGSARTGAWGGGIGGVLSAVALELSGPPPSSLLVLWVVGLPFAVGGAVGGALGGRLGGWVDSAIRRGEL
jgi:hypothetical protein